MLRDNLLVWRLPLLGGGCGVQIKTHGQLEDHVPWAFGTILRVAGVVWSPLRTRVFPPLRGCGVQIRSHRQVGNTSHERLGILMLAGCVLDSVEDKLFPLLFEEGWPRH